MITEAVILGLFALITAVVAKAKELYEIWVKFKSESRSSDDAKESLTVNQLKDIIVELRKDNSTQKSAINFLSREQMRYIRAEEMLWGYVQWLHDYADNTCKILKEHGLKVEDPPPMPKREVWTVPDLADFQQRTQETKDRLEKELAKGSSSQNKPVPDPNGVTT